jgi:hypothetical protein
MRRQAQLARIAGLSPRRPRRRGDAGGWPGRALAGRAAQGSLVGAEQVAVELADGGDPVAFDEGDETGEVTAVGGDGVRAGVGGERGRGRRAMARILARSFRSLNYIQRCDPPAATSESEDNGAPRSRQNPA